MTMHLDDLRRIYDYAYWANGRLFPVIAQLTPEQFTQKVAGGHGSIRDTLIHALSAEWGYMERCGGPKRGERLKADDYPTPDAVISTWKRVEEQMRGFLAGLTDADLERRSEVSFGGGPKMSLTSGDMLLQGALHGIHHRGQVSLALRMLGVTPGDVDYVLYAAQLGSK